LHRNIGLLVFRLHESTQGNLCRRCIGETFWRYTLLNLTLGWWGVISFIVTPIFLITNLLEYRASRSLALLPNGTDRVRLTNEERDRLHPLDAEVLACLHRGEPLELVAIALAEQTGVTTEQALVYITCELQNTRA
jgi:hypothetical protein